MIISVTGCSTCSRVFISMKIELAGRALDDEFDGARADVADGARRGDRGFAHRVAALAGHAGRGRFLEHLLVAALDRALALEQVHVVAVRIAEDLDLDVVRRLEVASRAGRDRRRRTRFASRCADASAAANSPAPATILMPLPPPPAMALMSTG